MKGKKRNFKKQQGWRTVVSMLLIVAMVYHHRQCGSVTSGDINGDG